VATLLGLCEFMEHMESTLPISIGLLSSLSIRCHALATALHYQEAEFEQTSSVTQFAAIAATPSDINLAGLAGDRTGASGHAAAAASIRQAEDLIESLLSINNKLGQQSTADGILKIVRAQQQEALRARVLELEQAGDSSTSLRNSQVNLKPVWLEKLQRWEDALEAYEQQQQEMHFPSPAHTAVTTPNAIGSAVSPGAGSSNDVELSGEFVEVQLGKMRCLRALGEWDELAGLAQGLWNRTDDPLVRRELCPLAAAAACHLHRWDSMAPLLMYWDDDGSHSVNGLRSSPASAPRAINELRHSFDANYYSAIFLIHRGRFDEARSCLDRAVEVLDPQLTALIGESYHRAYRSLLLLQRVAQLEEIIDFKLSGPASHAGASLSPRQMLLQRTWSSRMLGGLSRSGDDADTWSELLMQQQLLRAPGTPYYNESNIGLYLELVECSRKQAIELGTAMPDVPLPSISLLTGAPRPQNTFLARGERILQNLLGFNPIELLPDPSGIAAAQVPAMRRMQQVLETTRPRTKLPHLLFAAFKNLYAQGYRVQAYHRLRDMLVGQLENDVFPRALREAISAGGAAAETTRTVADVDKLKALCYIRIGKWQSSFLDESLSQLAPSGGVGLEAAPTPPITPYSPFPNSTFTFSSPVPSAASTNAALPSYPSSGLAAASASLMECVDWYRASTVADPSSVRAWHDLGMLLARMCTNWKFLLDPKSAVSPMPPVQRSISTSSATSAAGFVPTHHVVGAIHAFFRSISLQSAGDNSLQDLLRVLALWFEFGPSENAGDAARSLAQLRSQQNSTPPPLPFMSPYSPADEHASPPSISAAMLHGIHLIAIEHWLSVIPQLIARIHVTSPPVRHVLLELLHRVGRAHPQALIYPLMVASKSPVDTRRRSALAVLDAMRAHSNLLVTQASLVSEQLVRVAILWPELFHEGLEDASRLWQLQDFPAMMRVLVPLHALLLKPQSAMSIKEATFVATYGKELNEAIECCRRYERAMAAAAARDNEPDLQQLTFEEAQARTKALKQEARHTAAWMTKAWELYTAVYRKLAKQIQDTHELELSDISSQLLLSRELELAVPGTYRAGECVVRISLFEPLLRIIDSKQHPRRLAMLGSDGVSYTFLLKGHEDLRQDERVMQLFGLTNTLLAADAATTKNDLSIRRYNVIPLSPNSGLIEWVNGADPIHTVIARYRNSRSTLLNLEHRLMVKHAPNLPLCTVPQRIEAFERALQMTSGQDLANVLWLHSPSSEAWLERRRRFTDSCAVMSMVGYILGLGDRHTCNLLLEKKSGVLVHIDLGDCFEVSQMRERFPEKVPFRLTRMFVRAFAVGGLDGAFRDIAEKTLRVLRKNKNSIMAVLEAFTLDPLFSWRLLDTRKKPGKGPQAGRTGQAQAPAAVTVAPPVPPAPAPPAVPVPGSGHAHSVSHSPFLRPVAAPHSHVDGAGADLAKECTIVPVVTEHLFLERDATTAADAAKQQHNNNTTQQDQAASTAPAAAAAVVAAPTSILGMLAQPIPFERTLSRGHGAAAAVPVGATAAASAHAKAEEVIVAAAAEPGYGRGPGKKGARLPAGADAPSGVLKAACDDEDVSEGDGTGRDLPPSPARRRRSVVDERTLGLVREESGENGDASLPSGPLRGVDAAEAAAAASRLEQINAQALAVMARVDAKLKGSEFAAELGGPSAPGVTRVIGFRIGAPAPGSDAAAASSSSPVSPAPPAGLPATPLTVAAQVARLIAEATSHSNLAQNYIGWCPFW